MKIVPDTSVIINGKILSFLDDAKEIILPSAVLSELEHQANLGKEIGFTGLSVIMDLRDACSQKSIKLSIYGKTPSSSDIRNAHRGSVDAIIRDVASELGATLVTSDYVQSLVAKTYGLNVIYVEQDEFEFKIPFEQYISDNTLSVHLKEGAEPMAKTGSPGAFELHKLSSSKLSFQELKELQSKIIELARTDSESYIEQDSKGLTIVQLRNFRITMTKPPLSDGLEITIVKPLAKLSLEDYSLSDQLYKRLSSAEGIIIAGSPGAGKSTFAQALAVFYSDQAKIVKTIESPRDLDVPPNVTQYLKKDISTLADVLLLSRPDYTIFDELRTTSDFLTYVDLRLAGIGMVGVLHASKAIDAVQRFLGRVDIGMLSHVVDTIIYIDSGAISDVYTLNSTVKVPTMMKDKDLARPVVEVRDFESNSLLYEIYKFGEETVVMRVGKPKTKSRNFESLVPEIPLELSDAGKNYLIKVGKPYIGDKITVMSNGKPLFSAKVRRDGYIWIKKQSTSGKKLKKSKAIYGTWSG